MKAQRILIGALALALSLVLAVGLSQAEGPETPRSAVSPEEVSVVAGVAGRIPVQGKLTDATGSPLNGDYSITFRLYDVSAGGTALCQDTNTVHVEKGLFNSEIWGTCNSSHVDGRQLYLGLQVSGDLEMTPRQAIYPVPYAWSLRPGAIISNTATSGHGLEVWSAAGGKDGTALWVENTNTTSGIALWATANGSNASVIASNDGTGDLFKGFGGDGGEDEFRVNNNGSIESKADSYVFVPGTDATLNGTSTGVALEYYGMGNVQVHPSTTGEKIIQFGVVLPAVLYGQPVKVEEVTIFYETSNSGSYINSTKVFRQKASDPMGYYTLVDDATNRNSTTYTNYSVTPTSNNTLSVSEGFVSVELHLYFASAAHSVTIGGIRLRLGHHHLY